MTVITKTKELLLEILNVIANDCKAQYVYRNHNGCTCVIGGLAEHASIPLPSTELNACGVGSAGEFYYGNGKQLSTAPINDLVSRLGSRYGLTREDLQDLQHINDATDDLHIRRRLLRDEVIRIFLN